MCAWIERIMEEEDWESEIVPGQPGYVPRAAPIFKSTTGMSRSERRHHYAELLKQHYLSKMLHIQNPHIGNACKDRSVDASVSGQGTGESPLIGGVRTREPRRSRNRVTAACTPRQSLHQDRTPPAHQVAPTPEGRQVTYNSSLNCLLVVEDDGTVSYSSARGPGQGVLRLQNADRAV
ncbi:uncharacterized protein [Dermacentor albipictus]|uniref:uncharacterized protein isoform X2 n=1 Tax=Dermacentor albipictus TaxID=60249 RepID=UPI0031FBBBF0